MSNQFTERSICRGAQPKARYQIVSASMLEELLTIPSVIEDWSDREADLAKEYNQAKTELAEEEALLVTLIQAQTNAAGKPLYSNAESRAAALAEAKKKSPDWIMKSCEAADALDSLTAARTRLELYRNQLSSIRRVIALAAAELQLLTGGLYLSDPDDPGSY